MKYYCGRRRVSSSVIIVVSVLPVIFGLVGRSSVEATGRRCVTSRNETAIECRCSDNEDHQDELSMRRMNYSKRITSLRVTRCAGAIIDLSSFAGSDNMRDIVVRETSKYLRLGGFGRRMKLGIFKLVGINKISLLERDTFADSTGIENFHVQDAHIENFEQQFANIVVTRLTLINVTIDRMIGINLSDNRGESLTIRDSVIKNVIETTLNFAYFSNIDIRNSIFGMEKPGHLSIEAISAVVLNNVFTNLSVNVVASSDITIGGSCADGKSSLRLSSDRIDSFDNKLPTEIIYTTISGRKNSDAGIFPSSTINNNTVCVAGNCKCSKNNTAAAAAAAAAGYNSHERSARSNIYLATLMPMLLSFLPPALFF